MGIDVNMGCPKAYSIKVSIYMTIIDFIVISLVHTLL